MTGFSGRIGLAAVALVLLLIGPGRAHADVTVDFSGTLANSNSLSPYNGASLTGEIVVSGSLPVNGSTTIISYDFTIAETNNAIVSGSSSDTGASSNIAVGETFSDYHNGTVPLDVVNIGVGGTLTLQLDFLSPISSQNPEIIAFSGANTSNYNYNGYAAGDINPAVAAPEPGTLPKIAMIVVIALGCAGRNSALRRIA